MTSMITLAVTTRTHADPLFPIDNCWHQGAIKDGLYAGAFVGALLGGQANVQDTIQERGIHLLTSLGCGLTTMHIATFIVERLCFPLGTQFLGGASHKHTKLYYWVSACIASSLGFASMKLVEYIRHGYCTDNELAKTNVKPKLDGFTDQAVALFCPIN
jgi:hypothetical protein